ncbi:Ig-like domain-containing protein [Pseudogemmatithrix spongiicola]|uniref:Ig-like domain-containing protein n=1 Tax=Pseudogemmatithrix spongiicola TaxID=3062599 RepID=A0AA49JS20_9BACT|nr:Ig-like domain-containing protein [Gemmatimonadaceae bacterium 'strain 138']WKW13833.1 Ig-like domain-containing protein [Gemmatimonadaceae bacterium 'strain 318']
MQASHRSLSQRLGARPFFLGALALLIGISCKEVTGPEDSAVGLTVIAGDNQAGRVSSDLDDPIVVRVTNRSGAGVKGATVLFSPDSGSGAPTPLVATTDSTGVASVRWRLGPALGPMRLTASFADLTPVTVTATAVPDRVEVVSGDAQQTRVTGTLSQPLVVRVTDFQGRTVQGISVSFTPDSGSGTVAPALIATDAQGLARATWTLGNAAGAMRVVATVATSSPVEFSAIANQDVLNLASGGDQGARAGTTLPRPVQVRVTDQNGTPVANVIVNFEPGTGSGTVSPVSAQSNAQGIVQTNWTLGATPGAQTLTARSNFASPITVNAAGLLPSEILVVSGNQQITRVSTPVPSSLVVLVTDSTGRRVPGAQVRFVPDSGSGTVDPAIATTDTLGQANARWTLGASVGVMRLRAISGSDTLVFQATTTADLLTVTAGNGQTGRFGAALGTPLAVTARDLAGNTVAGVVVTFTPDAGSGTVAPASVTTDATGVARTLWTLGAAPGPMRVVASAATAAQSVEIRATASGDNLTVASGSGQAAAANAALPAPVVMQVRRADGTPVSGVTLTFAPEAGNGTVAPTTATTDANGRAQTVWTLGAAAGTQVLNVSSGTTLPTTVTATARTAASIAVTGDGQSARFGTALTNPIVATLTDLDGNAVAGATVTFTPDAGSGTLAATSVTTDALGRASTTWTLGGTPGAMRVTVSATGATSQIVNATATGDAIALEAGGGLSALVGTALSPAVRVRVTNAANEPQSNVLVTFAPTTGSGTVSADTVRTDSFGRAQVTWTLGAARGPMTLNVTTPVTQLLAVSATALAADAIALDTQGSLSGFVGTALDSTVRVRVTDRGGAVVPGVSVSFAPSAGSVSAATATTNASGIASVRWTLGTTPGAQTLAASVGASPTVNVSATARVDSSRAISVQSGDAQDTTLTKALGAPLVVRVLDRFGNAVQGATIDWTGTNGVTFSSSSSTTNASGDASVTVTTGTTLGAASVTATVSGRTESRTFTLTTQAAFTSVWAGNYFTCGLAERGEAYCWGFNQNKQLGSSATEDATNAPKLPVTSGSQIPVFRKIDGGENHGCGVTIARQAMCWGLGQGSFGVSTPTVINLANASIIEDVTVGSGHSCLLTASGTVACVGDNLRGQLGINTVAANATPYTPVDSSYSAVSAGGLHTCGMVRGSGRLMCWGDNQVGQVGDGTTTPRLLVPTPVSVGGGVTWDTTSLVTGDSHSCALNSAGQAICWGANGYGQLGNGTTALSRDTALVAGGLTFRRLAAGRDHTCGFTTTDSTAYCWGRNDAGQLGDSTTTNRSSPTAVRGGLKFRSIATGEFHSCGVASNASMTQNTLATRDLLYCWGDSEYGQAGTGVFEPNNTPILTPRRVSHQP